MSGTRRTEEVPRATDSTTWGGYLFLMVAYAVGTGLVVTVRRSWVYAGGAVAQVLVLGLFVVLGIGLLGPGLFEYAALADLPMGAAALVASILQVALLVVLVDLWRRTRRLRA